MRPVEVPDRVGAVIAPTFAPVVSLVKSIATGSCRSYREEA